MSNTNTPDQIFMKQLKGGLAFLGILAGLGAYALIRDEKPQNTQSGDFVAGVPRTRDLNVKVIDEIGITLVANQFTLPAGTYRFSASAPAHRAGRHQVTLENVSDATTMAVGESSFSSTDESVATTSRIKGQFTITASKTFELQHQCRVTQLANGFGVEGDFNVEVYASIELIKL